jgi:hypothetical protein
MAKGKCSKCGAESESKTNTYCKPCRREYQNERARRKKGKPEVKPEPVAIAGEVKCAYCGKKHNHQEDIVCGAGRTRSRLPYAKNPIDPKVSIEEEARTPQYNFPVVEIREDVREPEKVFVTPTGEHLGNLKAYDIARIAYGHRDAIRISKLQ